MVSEEFTQRRFRHPETGKPIVLLLSRQQKAHIDIIESEDCQHAKKEVRVFTASNGSQHLRWQCMHCGVPVGQNLKRIDFPGEHCDWDDSIQEKHSARKTKKLNDYLRKLLLQQENGVHTSESLYRAYLRSPKWGKIREKVLQRDAYLCQACLAAIAVQVHHKYYDRCFGEECCFDLVSVCRRCHEKLHPDETEYFSETDYLPCFQCRFFGGLDPEASCGKFSMLIEHALKRGGPCGPNADEFEGLK